MSSQQYVEGNSRIDQELTIVLNSRARKRSYRQDGQVSPAYHSEPSSEQRALLAYFLVPASWRAILGH
jgi:hypothetical protein